MLLTARLSIFFLAIFSCLSAQENNTPKEIPDPRELDISWWRYFEKEKAFDQNVDQLIENLQKLKKSIDAKRSQVLYNELDRVILALEQLKLIKKKDLDYTPVSPLYLENYFLSDWLRISQKLRNLNDEIEKSQAESEKIQAQMDLFRQNLDLYYLHYGLLEDNPKDHTLLGTKIMRARLEIAILEKQLEDNKRFFQLLESDKEKLQQEKAFASQTLSFDNLRVPFQEEKIEEAKQLYEEALAKVVASEKKRIEAIKTGKETQRSELQLLLAEIRAEQASSQVAFQSILAELAKKKKDPKIFEQKISDWKREFSVIENKFENIENVIQSVPLSESENILSLTQAAKSALEQLKSTLADTKLMLVQLEDQAQEKATPFWQFLLSVRKVTKVMVTSFVNFFTFTLFRINDYPITPLILTRALLIIAIFIFLGRLLLRFIKSNTRLGKKIGRSNLYTMGKMAYYALTLLGFLIAFFSLGFDMTNFLIIGGALGVGIGLGLQSIANNFFSGIVLLFEKRLRIGDFIDIDDKYMGKVQAINILNTQMRTVNGKDVIVPNADFLTKRLVNWTMRDNYLRMEIPFSTSYDSDISKIKQMISEAAKEFPSTILDETVCPPPEVWMVELADNAIQFKLAVWVDLKKKSSVAEHFSSYLSLIEKTLRDHQIEIPFPRRDIRFIDTQKKS